VRALFWRAVLAAVIVGNSSIDGQNLPSPSRQSVIRTGVDVVALNVTVTDGLNRYVTDLGQDDFLIFENGRKQDLTFFQKTSLPLALVLLLDTSASMQGNLGIAQEAAIGFARELGPEDQAAVIEFDSTVSVLQSFTNDRTAIERAIRHTEANGSTALYNAVYIALKELNKTAREVRGQPRRRALVLLSDGDDTSSLIAFDEVLDLAARADTAIYTIGLGLDASSSTRGSASGRTSPAAHFLLRRLAEQTGGRVFFPSHAKDLSGVYAAIKAELSSQYALAYESNNLRRDGQFRQIAVRVDRMGLIARTRPGYYASR
jgi:Ca-activated chloride channel family protein